MGFRVSLQGKCPDPWSPNMITSSLTGEAPGIFNIFPNGFNRGSYILIFFKGFQGPTQLGHTVNAVKKPA